MKLEKDLVEPIVHEWCSPNVIYYDYYESEQYNELVYNILRVRKKIQKLSNRKAEIKMVLKDKNYPQTHILRFKPLIYYQKIIYNPLES